MNRPSLYLLATTLLPLSLLLSACGSVSDPRPEPIRQSEYYLEHGVTAFSESDFVAASDFFHKALAHYSSLDNPTGILQSRINLAETALAVGNFDAALESIEAASRIAAAPRHQEYLPRLTLLRAQVHWRKQEREQALALLQGLLPEFDDKQRSREQVELIDIGAATLRTDIAFARQDDNMAEARLWLKRLSEMLRASEEQTPLHQARMLRFEAQLAIHEKAPQQATEKLEQALELYRAAAARPAIAATLTEVARLAMSQGQWQQAEQRLQRALYIRLWILDRSGALETIELLQRVYRQLGNKEKLEKMEREAARIRAPQ